MISMEKVLRQNVKLTPKLSHTVLELWVFLFSKNAALQQLNIEVLFKFLKFNGK